MYYYDNMSETAPKEGVAEKTTRLFRNINAIGAIAIGAAAIIAPPVAAPALGVWAGVNAAQAGGFEWLRQRAKKYREQQGGL